MQPGGCGGGLVGSGTSGGGGGGLVGSGTSGGGGGLGRRHRNIGNHCGGVPLRSDTRIVGKREPGLASVMPRVLPTRIPPCAIERRQVKRGACIGTRAGYQVSEPSIRTLACSPDSGSSADVA